MLSAFTRAFRTPDLRKKILFTLGIMALFRVGSLTPTPGISYSDVQACISSSDPSSGLLGIMNLFSGGALLQLSIFALGIMPYITASIIVQLLTVVIPRFEELKKEGQTGQTKMTQYTRYLTIGLAILQSATYVTYARNPSALFGANCTSIMVDQNWWTLLLMVVTMTAGTGLVMWLGELITDRGVGNGMSLLIFTSIVSGFPTAMWSGVAQNGANIGRFVLVLLVGVLIVAAVVFVEQSTRRVPVQYAKRMVGRRMYGGTSTYIPLKINMANVIPVIFASSLLQLPLMAAQFAGRTNPPSWAVWIETHLARGDGPWYMAVFFVLIVFFTFFYVSITFNPEEVADNMKKYGGFIPGIRAGRPTAQYLDYVLTRLTVVGALYLGLLSLIPLVALTTMGVGQNFPFGGTSLLIMVGVGLETVKQIESQLQQRHYEGFLR
ncbi:preprotein translocase subunit SecY [Arsenicicoccus piscis]|uniref:Protein translocase subunit SecY n=1 Tax=Arsenicicoccus piscis TaxID=673954 RepID=A0ABQ6HIH1_9MICO|nr:preprotein translocase subunit SecY [Arsenicicoccus piscis]MCH8627809.1 preprotein translocase subunit SecY [Arsenicicoccus piscis]GMA18328.1 protein translocase subunit SecY [Arsenicicoccus piscis]